MMKRFLAILCSIALVLGSATTAFAAVADNAIAIDGDWFVLEDFDDNGKTAADYAVSKGGKNNSSFLDNGEDGNAYMYTLTTTYGEPGIVLHDANRLPSDCTWYKYDLKGPAAIDSTVSAEDTFQFGIRFNDADPNGNRRLSSAAEADENNLAGCVYVRESGKNKWTKIDGMYTKLPNNFDGEVMVDLSLINRYVTGAAAASAPINIHSWFSERTLYSEMAKGEKIAVDNVCLTNKDMTPGVDGDWYILEDFDGDEGKVVSDYAVSGSANASLIDNGANSKAYQYKLTATYATPGIKLYGAKNFSADCTWYKFDLKGPKALDSSVADGDFQITVQFNDANGATRRLALASEVEDSSLTGCVYIRDKGELGWTKMVGINTKLPNDFDGEVMVDLNLVCVHVKSGSTPATYTSVPLNIRSGWFSERIQYANMAAGEKIAVDNIYLSNKDIDPKKVGNWYILEGFDSEDKTVADYAVSGSANASIIDNGANGKAYQYKLTTTYALPGIKLYGAKDLSADCTWYKFDLKGPKALDSSVADGDFQITVQFNDANGATRRLALASEVEDSSLVGCVYIRNKGEVRWTKMVGINTKLPNDFDGEVMVDLNLVCVHVKSGSTPATYTSVPLNIRSGWFSERIQYSNMAAGEKIAVDNICFTNDDMTPALADMYGDANKDGDVNILDLIRTKKYFAGTNYNISDINIDITKNGAIDTADAVMLNKILLGLVSF